MLMNALRAPVLKGVDRVARSAAPPPDPVAMAVRGSVARPVVQNASESSRIHPDPAKTVELRRILDQPDAEPSENAEAQTLLDRRRTASRHARARPICAGPTVQVLPRDFPRFVRPICAGPTTFRRARRRASGRAFSPTPAPNRTGHRFPSKDTPQLAPGGTTSPVL